MTWENTSIPSSQFQRRMAGALFFYFFKRDPVKQTLRANVWIDIVALANEALPIYLRAGGTATSPAKAAGQSPALTPVHVVESQPAPFSARAQLTPLFMNATFIYDP